VIGRQSVWSNPDIQALVTARFVPSADEVWRLQNVAGPEQDVFMRCADQGHYQGRGNTRQGIYACAPNGRFLASLNSNQPDAVEGMLKDALERWEALPEADRYLDKAALARTVTRNEDRFPAGGLALRVTSRDLPRTPPAAARSEWTERAHNVDFAWYTKDEARAFLPAYDQVAKGIRFAPPPELVGRLARFHFVDNVRGQTAGYDLGSVKTARLDVTVAKVAKGVIEVTLAGETSTEQDERGMTLKLYGTAKFDPRLEKFTAFELVATGARWGATRFNFREDDRERAPIGFLVTLESDDPMGRVAPAELGNYGWPR